MPDEVITTYLQDHRMGAEAGVDVFRRVAEHHSDLEVRAAVGRIADEVEADQGELEAIMQSLGATESLVKQIPAKIGAKLSQLKPNERLTGRSPLDDIEDLEMLVVAVHGKSLGWALLRELQHPKLDRERIERLHERALAQLDELERLRRSQAPELLHD